MTSRWATAWILCAAAASSAACGSTCLEEGDQLSVTLVADAAHLNDSGSGPQHVRYRAWAVKDAKMFAAAFAAKPANLVTDWQALQTQGLGDPLGSPSSEWIAPGARQPFVHNVTLEAQYSHVALVVLFPRPVFELVPLTCEPVPGYRLVEREHRVEMNLGRDAIELPKIPAPVED